MSIVDRKQRAKEEKILLMQTLMEGATTEEDVIRAKLDYDFINDCLEVSKVRSMMGLGTKKSGMQQFYDLIENLLFERLQKEYDLGLVKLDAIHITDVKEVWYNFRVKHIIIKGTRKIKHTNTLTFFAKDIDTAKDLFNRKIKQLKHELDSIISIDKSFSGITTNDGDYHRTGSFELIKITK